MIHATIITRKLNSYRDDIHVQKNIIQAPNKKEKNNQNASITGE